MDERQRFVELLTSEAAPYCSIHADAVSSLFEHYLALQKWNRAISLTTVDSLEEAVVRHYAESLFLAAHLPPGHLAIADVGSGAGFPGFPVAVLRPECRVTLIESVGKKAAFLREAARVPNVGISSVRAETLSGGYDWLVSRAVRVEDVLKLARKWQSRVALLVGAQDARKVPEGRVIQLPWGENRVLVVR